MARISVGFVLSDTSHGMTTMMMMMVEKISCLFFVTFSYTLFRASGCCCCCCDVLGCQTMSNHEVILFLLPLKLSLSLVSRVIWCGKFLVFHPLRLTDLLCHNGWVNRSHWISTFHLNGVNRCTIKVNYLINEAITSIETFSFKEKSMRKWMGKGKTGGKWRRKSVGIESAAEWSSTVDWRRCEMMLMRWDNQKINKYKRN